MSPLRIILVMVEPPLPFGNAAARWFYVLFKGLVERGHRVTAFAACTKTEDIEKSKLLFPTPQFDLRCYANPHRSGLFAKVETLIRPYSYMFSDDFQHDLNAEIEKGYDILHLEQMWSGWTGWDHTEKSLLSVHYLSSLDLQNAKAKDLRETLTRKLAFSAERRILSHFPNLRSCSERISSEILKIKPSAQIDTIPLGIDLSLYPYIPDSERIQDPVISVIGSMKWYPTWSAATRFIKCLWPEIKKRAPKAKAQIVGWDAKKALSEFANLSDVTITENVPDIRPYFQNTGVFLYAPERGSGMKIKIMEAFSYGIPVVTTREGVEGIPAQDGVHAGIAENDQGLIRRTISLLNSPEKQNKMRSAARALIEAHCGPKPTLDAIEKLYAKLSKRGA